MDASLGPSEVPDSTILAEIEGLYLTSRHAAQGALAGMHRSLRRGTSIEFSEHKVYTPGDDIRHIDWRAFAKTDRFHVKQFEDETNLRIEILVDHSGSMAFRSGEGEAHSKLSFTKVVSGALSYLALRQGDATGLCTFAEKITDELPPRASSSHLMEMLSRLARVEGMGSSGITQSIDQFAQRRRRRTVAIVLSDLFDPNPDLLGAFRRLAARRHDVTVFHVLDPWEVDFPYENPSIFHSIEDDRRLFVHPRTLRSAYTEEMKAFLERTATSMSEIGIDYRLAITNNAPARVLGDFLRTRAARRG